MYDTPFGFRHFESLPADRRLPEAQAKVDNLFPPGSKADDFEQYFKASGAKCTRGKEHSEEYIVCIYHMQGMSIISTDWTVATYLNSDLSTISRP